MNFLRTDGIHMVPDDGVDLHEAFPAEGQPVVYAGTYATNEAGSHHELVRDDFRIGGHFPRGGYERFRPQHVMILQGRHSLYRWRSRIASDGIRRYAADRSEWPTAICRRPAPNAHATNR